jgi:hypothetical protein
MRSSEALTSQKTYLLSADGARAQIATAIHRSARRPPVQEISSSPSLPPSSRTERPQRPTVKRDAASGTALWRETQLA